MAVFIRDYFDAAAPVCDFLQPRREMKLLTVKETSAVLRVSPARLYDLCRQQLVPCVRIGRAVRVEEGALRDWIAGGGQALPGGWRAAESPDP